MINTPKLPPKAGYVEVEVNGKRVYQKVPSPYAETEEVLNTKLAIAELAEAQAADMLEVKLAIAELAEALLGGE